MNTTRRRFLLTTGATATSLFVLGCMPEFRCERDKWYWQKRKDLIERIAGNESIERQMNKVILGSVDKLARALQPDYLPFPDVEKTTGEIKRREDKKTLGVIDIYSKDSTGVRMFDDYLTDFLIAACMSNVRIGENFRIVERYKLSTLLREYDTRKSLADFDPRDAIKRGYFKGVDAVITGNIYTSNPVTDADGDPVYGGGAHFLIRMIDVTEADIVANAAESLPRGPFINDWIKRKTVRRR
jgi:hypothetical protein